VTAGSARWEQAAEAYATGEHKWGRELELVVEFASPTGNERALDIGAGAGHTALALAPHVSSVVVTDPVEAMLASARNVFAAAGVTNAQFRTATAEALPFADTSFDIVATRLAAHHFDDVALALGEVFRVLRPGGVFIFVDTLAPDDAGSAEYQDEVERLRDPTHRRSYARREWVALCEHAGFGIERTEEVRKAHDFEPWLERGGEDAATQQRVRLRFLDAPANAIRDMQIVIADGRVRSFTDRKLVLAARRPKS